MEQPGSKALRYRTAGSMRQADRVFALLVPAVLEAPRVGRAPGTWRRSRPGAGSPESSSQQHLLRSGEVRHDSRRKHRARGARTVGQLAGERLDRICLQRRDVRGAAVSGRPAARGPGGRRVSPSATSRSGSSARAGLPAGPRVPPPHGRRGRPLPRAPGIPRIRHTVRAGGRLARPHGALSPVSGRRSRITSMSWTPSTCRAAADSAVLHPGNGLRIGSRMRCLAVRDRDQAQPGPRGGQHGHRPAHAQDLVVRMSGDDHDARPAQRVSGRKMLQPGPGVASVSSAVPGRSMRFGAAGAAP